MQGPMQMCSVHARVELDGKIDLLDSQLRVSFKHNADVISLRCTATVGMWFSDCSVAMPCPVLRQLMAKMLSEKEYCEIVPVMITRCPNPHLIDSWSNYLAYANISQLFEGSTSIEKK